MVKAFEVHGKFYLLSNLSIVFWFSYLVMVTTFPRCFENRGYSHNALL
jgi:hypothetical protein